MHEKKAWQQLMNLGCQIGTIFARLTKEQGEVACKHYLSSKNKQDIHTFEQSQKIHQFDRVCKQQCSCSEEEVVLHSS